MDDEHNLDSTFLERKKIEQLKKRKLFSVAGAATAPGWWGAPPCRLPPAAAAALVLAKEGLGRSLAVATASATAPG